MATSEIPGLLKYKDENGNINLLLPITTKDNVDGLDEIEADLNETVKYTTQELNEAQKAQARANIGITEIGNPTIIDVTALPIEDIRDDCFYRLVTATFMYGQSVQSGWVCHAVNGLPENYEPATTDMFNVVAYYNTVDGDTYAYIDEALSSTTGVPVGLYTLETLAPTFNVVYGGVTTNIVDDPNDTTVRLLIEHSMYSYKEGWEIYNSVPTVTEGDDDKSLIVQNGQWTTVPSIELRSYKLMEPANVLEPAKYYVFGEVNSLDVTLQESDDNLVSEYCFEFVATEDFGGLTITPEPRWATPVQFVKGKTHQVSIMRGIGVMIRA